MHKKLKLAIISAVIAAILWLGIILAALYLGPAMSSGELFWGVNGIVIWIIGIVVVTILMFIILHL